MKRAIVSFDRDEEQDWIVHLGCGHRQHMRHDPPFSDRAWVLTEAGRRSRLGAMCDCVRCDRAEIPERARAYKRTKTFDESSVPAGLLANHATKAGVWGLIRVLAGELEYAIEGDESATRRLRPGDSPGVVVPEVLHRVQPVGAVRFFVEFHRVPAGAAEPPPT